MPMASGPNGCRLAACRTGTASRTISAIWSGVGGDVDVHGDHVRAGSVRVDDVRGAPDARAAAGHRFAHHAELDQFRHQHADGRAGQPETLGELGAGQCAVAMHLTQHRGQVVAPHRLGSCRG
jgi:hypothetical protein